jgi:hypothetical protein
MSDDFVQDGLFDHLYGGAAPHQKHSDTSILAALEMSGTRRATLRAKVFRYLVTRKPDGATDEEMQIALKMVGNTQRPRRCELEEAGLVCDSGLRRRTGSGKSAVVWVVVPFAVELKPKVHG